MRKELLSIENGMYIGGGEKTMYSIFLQIFSGTVTGIFSDNRVDLENMMQIASGRRKMNYGKISFREEMLSDQGDTAELKREIAVVGPKSALIPNITIAQNIFAIRNKTNIFYNKKECEYELRKHMDLFDIRLSVDCPVKKLNIVQRIEMEMLKAWLIGKSIIILDLKGIYFSEEELQILKQYFQRYKQYDCAILVFDQSMDRLFYLTDKITVLSRGKTIGVFPCNEEYYQKLMNLFQSSEKWTYSNAYKVSEDIIFCMNRILMPGLPEINISVSKGEVLTVQAPNWSVSEKLIALFKGEITAEKGDIWVKDRKYRALGAANAPRQSIVVMEPPYLNMLFDNLNVYDNFCLARGCIRKGLWANEKYKKNIREYIKKVFGKDISKKRVGELNPSEAQKLVWFRWIFYSPEVFVCVDPVESVDIKLRKDVRQYLSLLSEQGTAVIVIERNVWKYHNPENRHIRIECSNQGL